LTALKYLPQIGPRTWRADPAFDNAIAEQDTIDPELWR
jgi:hypothetical protein